MKVTKEIREPFESAVANMYSNDKFKHDYLYYAHIVGQLKLHFDDKLPAVAGVNFMYDTFNLYINPTGMDLPEGTTDNDGNPVERMEGFNELPLEQRMGVLKHECGHILMNHIGRKQDRDHSMFNRATDCAWNQSIKRDHLPDGVIYPDNLLSKALMKHVKVPEGQTAEHYYELIDENEDDNGDGQGQGGGQGSGTTLDDHGKWEESQGSQDLQKDIAKNMAEKAASAAQKSIGSVPSEFSDFMDILSRTHEVAWQDVLRFIFGNVKSSVKKTVAKANRMLPDFEWLKGKTFNRTMTPLIVSDVSGSVSNEAALAMWAEMRGLCEETQAEAWLIQVDTQPSTPEKLTAETSVIERKACGGTYLSPALKMAEEHNLDYDAVIITTDGYLDNSDIKPFAELGLPVIWLVEKQGRIMDEMVSGNMQGFQLKE